MPGQELNLLCFDGGGVRGLSSLYVLQRLMLAKDPENPPKPCEYFDMIGGTSTGGLIAIMLGRLRMSVDECIAAYIQLSSGVFEQKHVSPITLRGKTKARYSSKKLQQAIQNIVEEDGLDKDELLKDISPQACKVFVCATSEGASLPFLLRSYSPIRETPDLYHVTKIWEAGRATSAASTFFDPISIGPLGQKFLDGGTGANNPIRQLWNEAADVFCDGSGVRLAQNIRTLVSIGTGVPDLQGFGRDPFAIGKTLLSICTETETTAEDFHRSHSDLDDEGRYFRFNVARGLAAIGLEEASEAQKIKELTDVYLMGQASFSAIRRCARMLGGPILTSVETNVQSQSLVIFPATDSDDLYAWMRRSKWQVGKHRARIDTLIFDRISTYDALRIYKRLSSRKSEGTTAWLRSNKTFTHWLAGTLHRLWVSGKVGSGKSILMTTIVEECLCMFPDKSKSAILVYHYESADHSARSFFCSMVKQLLAALIEINRPCPTEHRARIEDAFGDANRIPDTAEVVTEILVHLLSLFENVVIILDGVDKCDERQRHELWKYIRLILQAGDVRFVICSQDHANITGHLTGFQRLRMDQNLNESDIKAYIDNQIDTQSGTGQIFNDEALRNDMKKMLCQRADGMFLWVYLVLDIVLNDCRSPSEVKEAVQKLPGRLEDLYMSCLSRTHGSRLLCDPLLLVLVCVAPEPMHQEALRQLLVLDSESGNYEEDHMMSLQALTLSGVGLVVLDASEQLVVLAHDSIQDFIFSTVAKDYILTHFRDDLRKGWLQHNQYDFWRANTWMLYLGRSCLSHIQKRTLRSLVPSEGPAHHFQDVPSPKSFLPTVFQDLLQVVAPRTSSQRALTLRLPSPSGRRERPLAQQSFLTYATKHWIACNKDLLEAYEDWTEVAAVQPHRLRKRKILTQHWNAFVEVALERNESWGLHPWQAPTSQTQHLLGMFAYGVAHGHAPLLKVALNEEKHLPLGIFQALLPDHGQLPALHVASKEGHVKTFRMLLHVSGPHFARCYRGRTPLHYAAEFGHVECARELIRSSGTEPEIILRAETVLNAVDELRQTALHLAAANDRVEMVTFLCEVGADISLADYRGETPATCALNAGHGNLASLLLSAAEVAALQIIDDEGVTALMAFAKTGDAPLVSSLCWFNDPHAQDRSGLTALWHASRNGHLSVVEALLHSSFYHGDREIHVKDSRGVTALGSAMESDRPDIVKALINSKLAAQSLVRDIEGWLPIERAIFGRWRRSDLPVLTTETITSVGLVVGTIAPDGHSFASFLQSAAETGNVDAVANLLRRWKVANHEGQLWQELMPRHPLEYLKKRSLRLPVFHSMRIDALKFPIAIFLAAMRQHEDVLALLLEYEETSLEPRYLIEIARAAGKDQEGLLPVLVLLDEHDNTASAASPGHAR